MGATTAERPKAKAMATIAPPENGAEGNTGHPLSRRGGTHGEVVRIKANEEYAEQEGREAEAHGRPDHPP